MLPRKYRLALAAGIYFFGSSHSAGQVVRIKITSSWGGLGAPSHGDFLISGKGGRYSADGKTVQSKAVEALLAALDEPQVREPSISNCGIDQAWLDSNYEAALRDQTHRKLHELSPKQIELFKTHFADLNHAQEAFAGLFKSWHTDDYPKMSVTVTIDGKTSGVQSDSQSPFMLPWDGTDKVRGGYNCHISQSIAALLPKKFLNRERLMPGESFRWELTAEVMQTIQEQWNMLDTENLVGNEVAPVFARYSPVKSAVSCLGSIDVDYCGWNATLTGSTLPSNMVIGVSLPFQNKKKLTGVQSFLAQLPRYAELVQSVPWLSAYMKDHHDTIFELRYVVDRSLSSKAQASLEEDLRKHGNGELADVISEHARDSAFLEIDCGSGCWSRAVVLPNRNVLLWHFKGDSVLGYSERELNSWEYYGWRSTGVVVTPDGILAK